MNLLQLVLSTMSYFQPPCIYYAMFFFGSFFLAFFDVPELSQQYPLMSASAVTGYRFRPPCLLFLALGPNCLGHGWIDAGRSPSPRWCSSSVTLCAIILLTTQSF